MSAETPTPTTVENATSYFSSPTIKIIVGDDDETRTFFAHKDLLTSRSRFFAKALRGYQNAEESSSADTEVIQWKEGEEGAIELPDDEPDVFEAYLQFIYSDRIPICSSIAPRPSVFGKSVAEQKKATEAFEAAEIKKINLEYNLLAQLYILAEKIQDVATKRSVLSAFVESTSKLRYNNSSSFPVAFHINLVYDNTLPEDPLREFLTDCYVLAGHSGWTGNSYTAFNQEFLFDLMVGMYKMRSRPSDVGKIKNAKVYIEKIKADEE